MEILLVTPETAFAELRYRMAHDDRRWFIDFASCRNACLRLGTLDVTVTLDELYADMDVGEPLA
jgi:hypothetical protein